MEQLLPFVDRAVEVGYLVLLLLAALAALRLAWPGKRWRP